MVMIKNMTDNTRKGVSLKETMILTPKLMRSAPANAINNIIINLFNLFIIKTDKIQDGFTGRCSNPIKFVNIKFIRWFY